MSPPPSDIIHRKNKERRTRKEKIREGKRKDINNHKETINIAEQNEFEIVPNEYVKRSFIRSYLSH